MSLDERLRESLRRSSSAVAPDLGENLHAVRRKTRHLVIRQRVGQVAFAMVAVLALVFVAPRVLDFAKNDPCKGAPAEFVRIIRFKDGHLLIFDPPHQELGGNTLYTIVDDHTFTLVSAPGDHNLPGVYRFTYRIVGDQLTIVDLNHDVDTGAAFEVAPFVRAG